jgi:photosystem II stability/assembly factor-like uncharacterized protein
MKIYFLVITILASQFAFSQNQWTMIYYQNIDKYFRDVHYLNPPNAWAVSQGGVIAYSNTGGDDWEIQYEKPEFSFGGVYFTDDQTGYVVGWSEVFKTINGGEDWQQQSLPNPMGLDVEEVYFVNQNMGWIAGSYKTIYKTVDGGESWLLKNGPDLDEHYWLNDITFFDELNGCAVGEKLFMPYKGIILTTDDGGESWGETIINYCEGLKSVQHLSQDTIWAISEDGKFIRSTNAGEDWEVIQQIAGHFTDLYFFNSNDAIAISNSHLILTTNDGWATWESAEIGFSNIINKFSFADPQNGIGVGSSNISRTIDGGSNWYSSFDKFSIIDFFEADNGWMVSENEPKHLLHSTDEGYTWELFYAVNKGKVQDMDFISSQVGFAVTDSSELMKTLNGGESWEIINIPIDSVNFSAINFIDNEVGFITTSNSSLLKTEDGGDSWFIYTFDNISYLTACFFQNELEGWVTGWDGEFAHTVDGGLNWVVQFMNDENWADICFTDSENGFMISRDGSLYTSNDGGIIWDEMMDLDNALRQIEFVDNVNGWIRATHFIYRTYDGGMTWEEEFDLTTTGWGQSISSLAALSENDAWFCTNNGKIFTYDFLSQVSDDLLIEPNLYPNPANNVLNISSQFKSGNHTIEIYSIDGRKMLTQQFDKTEDPVQMDVSAFNPGIYILKIKGQKGVFKWIKQ